jgi:hypothetical protein
VCGTYIGHINLSATSTGRGSAKAVAHPSGASTKVSSASHTAVEPSTRGSWIAETRLGLSVFADIDESTHKVLITERRHGILRLLPVLIFHDSTALSQRNTQSITIQHSE